MKTARHAASALALVSVLILPASLTAPTSAVAIDPTFVVDRVADGADAAIDGVCAVNAATVPAGQGKCSLRAAIAEANAASGVSTIVIGAGTFRLDGGGGGDTGDLDITKPMTIRGARKPPGARATTIDGAGVDRVFEVSANPVTIDGVVITGGAARVGAGVLARAGSSLQIIDSTVENNNASDQGGGVDNSGQLDLRRSTVAFNKAVKKGGGVHNAGSAMVVNATVHGNESSSGGGVVTTGSIDLVHVTVTGNRSTNKLGGGVQRVGGTTTIRASVIALNQANSSDAKDCSGSPFLAGANLIGNVSGCNPTGQTPLTGDPLINALGANGGATNTQALRTGSQAIDVLAPSACGSSEDQRRVARPQTLDPNQVPARCDLGAFEVDPFSFSLDLSSDRQTVPSGASIVPTQALYDASSTPSPSGGTTASPLRSIPLRSVLVDSIDVDAVPLRSVATASSPLRSVPLRSVFLAFAPLRSIPLRSVSLDSILLSEVEIEGGWEALLVGTPLEGLPLQTLTLADVSGLAVWDDDSLSIGKTDLASTRIGALSLVSVLLGSTPLRSVTLPGLAPNATDAEVADAWCSLLGTFCADVAPDFTLTADTSLLTLDLAAAPLRSVPLRSVMLSELDLSASPLRSVPLRSVRLADLAPGSLDSIVDCTLLTSPCDGHTIGEVADANAFRDDASIAHLLLALVGPETIGWEDIDLTTGGLGAVALPPKESFTYRVDMRLGGGKPADVALDVQIPSGFVADPGSVRLDGAVLADPAFEDQTLAFELDDVAPGDHELTFVARAGVVLGDQVAHATGVATVVGQAPYTAEDSDVTVIVEEAFEPLAGEPQHQDLVDGALHIAHIGEPGDVDRYRFEVSPLEAANGATISLHLSNLGADFDLALFGPPSSQLRGAAEERRNMLPDHLIDLQPGDDNLTAEPTADVPQTPPAGSVLHRVAGRRGLASETIEAVGLREGEYWVQVSSANGAQSDQPYVLRSRRSEGVDRGPCDAQPLDQTPRASSTPALAEGLDTVFLVNRQRFTAAYGSTGDSASALAALASFAGRTDLGFIGGIVYLDALGDQARDQVQTAYGAWDVARCDVGAANDVVREIGDVIDAIASDHPDLRNLVIVGGDQQIPMARVADNTVIANERTFADELTSNNELVAALGAGHVLTDNAYATHAAMQVNDHEVFVPELAVGRLVETPAEIMAMLASFDAADGQLDPTTALVAGYDFLSDGATAVADELSAVPGLDVDRSLIDITDDDVDPWTAQTLYDSLAGLSPGDLASVNAHFDHHRLLPAAGDAQQSESDLFLSSAIDGTVRDAVARSILFSMGCHSGLSVADVLVSPGASDDWAQTFAGAGASWLGNTGYGYGDTETVALSERLMAAFARRLVAGDSVGEALSAAKREYMSTRALVSSYDEKVVQEAVLYGLPMLRLGAAAEPFSPLASLASTATASTPAAPPLVPDPFTDIPSAARSFDFTRTTDGTQGADILTLETTGAGSYYHVDGETLTQSRRPIQPLTSVDVTDRGSDGEPGKRARGVLVTELTSVDQSGFSPSFFTPTVDLADHEPAAVAADATFPSVMAGITSTHGPDGREDRLVVVPGQFRGSSTPGLGTERLFTNVDATVYYGDGPAAGPPIGMNYAEAIADNEGVRFEVELDADAARVYVLHKVRGASGSVEWSGVDLVQDPDNGHWIGHDTTTGDVEYIVQIVGFDGRVFWADQKGMNFDAETGDVGALAIVVTPATQTNGWYTTSPLMATVVGSGLIEYSLDGAPYADQALVPIPPITGDGAHTLLAKSGGFTISQVLLLDGTAPVIAVSAPAEPYPGWYAGSVTLGLEVGDGNGSGIASWSYQVNGGASVSPAGTSTSITVATSATVTVTATDVAGHVSQTSRSFGIDAAQPTIVIRTPEASAFYGTGSSVVADYECADAASGLASCTASVGSTAVADGAALPTASAGTFTLRVVARDNVGNTTEQSRSYTVGVKYRICPQYDTTQPNLIGSTIPIKIQLCDASGRNLSSATIPVEAVSIDGAIVPPPNWVGNTNYGNVFRFGQKTYIYNLDTEAIANITAGEHWMYLRINGVAHSDYRVKFTLRL